MDLSRRIIDLHNVDTIEIHLGTTRTPLVYESRVARCRSAALPVLKLLLDSVREGGLNHDLRVKLFFLISWITSLVGMEGLLTMIFELKNLTTMYGTNRPSCLINDTR